jgi:hypothetical protein
LVTELRYDPENPPPTAKTVSSLWMSIWFNIILFQLKLGFLVKFVAQTKEKFRDKFGINGTHAQ